LKYTFFLSLKETKSISTEEDLNDVLELCVVNIFLVSQVLHKGKSLSLRKVENSWKG